jgi:peptide deformylase
MAQMSTLTILVYPDKRLKKPALPVTTFDDSLRQTVSQLFLKMAEDQGVGLAATQVGLSLRIFVMDCSHDQSRPFCMINPQILSASDEQISEEGCLSFPGIYIKVKRANKVTVQYQNEWGETHTLTTENLEAHCIQHEMEHLDGIVFIDHLSPLKRQWTLKKLAKTQRLAG